MRHALIVDLYMPDFCPISADIDFHFHVSSHAGVHSVTVVLIAVYGII